MAQGRLKIANERPYALLASVQERIRGMDDESADILSCLMGNACLQPREAQQIAHNLVAVVMTTVEGHQVNLAIHEFEGKVGQTWPATTSPTVFYGAIEGYIVLDMAKANFVA